MRAARCVVLPDGRVVHAQIAADGAHDNLAGVQPDADLQVHAMGMEASSAWRLTRSCMRRAA